MMMASWVGRQDRSPDGFFYAKAGPFAAVAGADPQQDDRARGRGPAIGRRRRRSVCRVGFILYVPLGTSAFKEPSVSPVPAPRRGAAEPQPPSWTVIFSMKTTSCPAAALRRRSRQSASGSSGLGFVTSRIFYHRAQDRVRGTASRSRPGVAVHQAAPAASVRRRMHREALQAIHRSARRLIEQPGSPSWFRSGSLLFICSIDVLQPLS